ncbi:hypothetical protein L195_g017676 [Trifolium pratense]|uniref:Uncharacterized protein n=1 Tax=Trifolium pratense TaxID=57577 RepID=A0A2K3MUL9_TRIPR|nr:hypothetical protein L195_g017676 [Trifolium pratense]
MDTQSIEDKTLIEVEPGEKTGELYKRRRRRRRPLAYASSRRDNDGGCH